MRGSTILCLLVSCTLAGQQLTPSRLIRINGSLRPADGRPAAAIESLTLSVYGEETGGSALWQETQDVPVDPEGRYTVLLGAQQDAGVPLELFRSGEARWLGVLLNRPGESESPRALLTSVPYAVNAETLGGRPASDYVLAKSAARSDALSTNNAISPLDMSNITGSGTADAISKFVGSTQIGDSTIVEKGGLIGIGTTTPNDRVSSVFADATGVMTGYSVRNTSGSATAYSGMLFYDQNAALGLFQGFNNSSHEYRINNIAPSGTINFMIGSGSRFKVANNGNIGIGTGTGTPGEKVHIADGNLLLDFNPATQERALIVKARGTLSSSPAFGFVDPQFQLGRVNIAGDGWPEFKVFYLDNGKTGSPDPSCEVASGERPVLKFDAKGIVASVKRCAGAHFEGYLQDGDTQPVFRLNSNPSMQLEMGAGGSMATDVSLRRVAANTVSILTGGQERVRVDSYIRIPTVTGEPPSGDCDDVTEAGRLIVRTDGSLNLYICLGATGWTAK